VGPCIISNTLALVIVVAGVATAANGPFCYFIFVKHLHRLSTLNSSPISSNFSLVIFATVDFLAIICYNSPYTKLHTRSTRAHYLSLSNRKLIKYSQGRHVITLHSTKHTDSPQQTTHSFRGPSTIHNFKHWIAWRQWRTNVTTSRVRHVIICWGKVRRWDSYTGLKPKGE
jgi:hypothetical protein